MHSSNQIERKRKYSSNSLAQVTNALQTNAFLAGIHRVLVIHDRVSRSERWANSQYED